MYLFIYLFIYLCIYLFIYLFIYLYEIHDFSDYFYIFVLEQELKKKQTVQKPDCFSLIVSKPAFEPLFDKAALKFFIKKRL